MMVKRNAAGSCRLILALMFAVYVVASAGCASARSSQSADQAEIGARQTTSINLPAPSVKRPLAPSSYRVPQHSLRVSSSRGLRSALADGRTETIVLASGTYDSDRPFSNRDGDRLYAAHLGRAVLRAGIVLGANAGPAGATVRGIRFDVTQPRKTFEGALIHVWGSASHVAVLDTWLDGNGVVDAGLVVRQPEDFRAQRVVATSFRSYGVLVDPNQDQYSAQAPYVLTDLDLSHVVRRVPGSSDGTAEACLWLGSRGTVSRVSARRCGVSGIWTGTANMASRVEDVAVDRTPVGIYIEHFTTGTTFRRLRIGPNVARGVNAEWANHALAGRPASLDNVIEDGYFKTTIIGVYLDEGTTRTSVRRCKFVGQTWAAIGDYKGVGNEYYRNDFTGVAPRAVAVSYNHGGEP
jgi:hypothetical protein